MLFYNPSLQPLTLEKMSFQHSSPPLTTELSIQDVERASERIIKYIHRTPVLSSSTLSAMTGIPGCTLYLKCENFNKVGSYGASYCF